VTAKYKPTPEEKRIIRACARRDAGFKSVEINPSTKYNLTDRSKPEHMNICFVSDDPDFKDADLSDNAFTWGDFARGVELKDGRAIVDFYVYNRGKWSELQTNVTIWVEDGRLVDVRGTGKTRWNHRLGFNFKEIAS
jgi:hypothetical protein